MKGCTVVLGTLRDRKAAARLIDGQLDDLLIDGDSDAPPAPGTVFRAICDRPVKGQGGMFLRLPGGASGFLRQVGGLAAGQSVLVQVSGYAEPGKAVPVTDRILFKSRYCIVTPGAPGINIARGLRDDARRDALLGLVRDVMPASGTQGVILRSAAETGDDDAIVDDLSSTWRIAQAVMSDAGQGAERLLDAPDAHQRAWRDWVAPHPDRIIDDPASFEREGVNDLIADLAEPEVRLGNGASMVIEPTRALIAVDVNTGTDGSPAAGLKANIAVARALPRQLRCRGLGGQIVVDFAPAPKKDRRQIESALKAAFRDDPVATSLVGWTTLGLFELQRQRLRRPLAELLK